MNRPAVPDPAWAYQFGVALRSFRPGHHQWRFCLIDGPNMANLGRGGGTGGRDPRTYGSVTSLNDLQSAVSGFAEGLGTVIQAHSSYHEADLVALVYETAADCDGFFVNPAALTRFGAPLRIALVESRRPLIELHFSNISAIGWQGGQTTPLATAVVMGLRQYSYLAAVFGLICALDAGEIDSRT